MKKLVLCVLTGVMLTGAVTTFAATIPENRAVNISIGSIGGKIDAAALRTIRQVVGFGIASGAVDTFTVNSPKSDAVPIEGGLTACADAGFSANKAKFSAFIQDLRAIKVKAGSFYNVVPAVSCTAEPPIVFCTQDAKACPDGSYVSRVAPSCAFSPCPVSQ